MMREASSTLPFVGILLSAPTKKDLGHYGHDSNHPTLKGSNSKCIYVRQVGITIYISITFLAKSVDIWYPAGQGYIFKESQQSHLAERD